MRCAFFPLLVTLVFSCSADPDSSTENNLSHVNNTVGDTTGTNNPANNVNNTTQNSTSTPCVVGEPVLPENPFTSGPECELREELVSVECPQGTCEEIQKSNEWCQYGSCGASRQATCAPYEVTTVPVPYGVDEGGVCKQMCRLYTFTEVVCGTTYGCEIHDAGWDICSRRYVSQVRVRLCQFTWNCWVDERYDAQEWCAWMLGNPGPSGYTHLVPYAQERSELEEIPIPYVDVEGECPQWSSTFPPLPEELQGLPVKREPVAYFDTIEDDEVPDDYDITAAACNDSLPYADDYIRTMCENI